MTRTEDIEFILRFIRDNNVRPMRKWSLRNLNATNPRYAYFKKLKENLIELLNLLSGNDYLSMLRSKNSKKISL